MTQPVNLNSYTEFVNSVTSAESNDVGALIKRLQDLSDTPNLNVSLFLNSAIGLGSEGGEFQEIAKKVIFQGKPFNEDVRFHLKRELSDIAWYFANACRSIGYSIDEVIAENVDKLSARYPGGKFDVFYSENRKEGDL